LHYLNKSSIDDFPIEELVDRVEKLKAQGLEVTEKKNAAVGALINLLGDSGIQVDDVLQKAVDVIAHVNRQMVISDNILIFSFALEKRVKAGNPFSPEEKKQE